MKKFDYAEDNFLGTDYTIQKMGLFSYNVYIEKPIWRTLHSKTLKSAKKIAEGVILDYCHAFTTNQRQF